MNFDGNELDVDRIRLKEPLYYVFADLMAHKDTVKILADLNAGYTFAKNDKEKALHDALGKDNQEIIRRAMEYMSSGDTESLGKLMMEAQELFDKKVAPMCPEELTSPVLHKTLNDPVCKELSLGGKGVGSQGDGTIQFLTKDAETQKKLVDHLHNDLGMTAYPLTLKPKALVHKAVIPVAGFGTRLYPETRGVKKEFCPVIDKDGLMKPGILMLLEELNAIEDIDEICLILNEEEKRYYEEFFFSPLSDEHYNKLSNKMKAYESRIREIASKIRLVFQEEQKGFGHAVYQTMKFAAGEPVLLLLDDTIYQSKNGTSCTKQLLDAYQSYGHTMVALQSVPLELVGNYGLFAGVWDDKNQNVLKISNVKEKPSVQETQEYMSVPPFEKEENYYGAFGSNIITPEVYEWLDKAVKNNIVNAKGEVELTDALAYVSEHDRLMGFVPDGESFDLGNPEAYRYAVTNFGRVSD